MLVCGATAIGAYAAPTSQSGTTATPILVDEEYSKWKIDKKDGAYYYENERVRIFMDLRENNSFVNFNCDVLGTIDIRLVRGHNGDITKIEYLSQTEAEEILTDLDVAHSNLIKEDEDVSRLSKDMISEKVLNTINSCDAGTWYVVVENEYQYIYYNGAPHNYAWQPEIGQDSATIQIFDIGKSTSTYVLLKVPASLKLDVYYNATKIKYETVNIQ